MFKFNEFVDLTPKIWRPYIQEIAINVDKVLKETYTILSNETRNLLRIQMLVVQVCNLLTQYEKFEKIVSEERNILDNFKEFKSTNKESCLLVKMLIEGLMEGTSTIKRNKKLHRDFKKLSKKLCIEQFINTDMTFEKIVCSMYLELTVGTAQIEETKKQ